MKPQQVFEALPEEKQAVRKYALEHPEIRHRELSWRMLDDDIVALSSSSVYRILREQDLMQRQRGRTDVTGKNSRKRVARMRYGEPT
jgi:hypothetical protein